ITHCILPLLETSRGDALDKLLLGKQEHKEQRCERQHRHGEHCSPVRRTRRIEKRVERNRDGVVVRRGEIDQWSEKVIPRPDEREHGGDGERWPEEWENDAPEHAERSAAVDGRGIVELTRQAANELDQEKHEERIDGQKLWHH